jgi:putative ABC transport system permease protein
MPTIKLPIASLTQVEDTRVAIKNHLTIIASFLIIMSLLVVLVGGLGLATTVSINTVERTKEIGILRSIGGKQATVTGIIVSEGIVIGILSWVISLLLSFPISRLISYRFGMIFFDAPLEFAVSINGYLIWFAIVIIFAALASYYPSKKATTMSLRDALAYE